MKAPALTNIAVLSDNRYFLSGMNYLHFSDTFFADHSPFSLFYAWLAERDRDRPVHVLIYSERVTFFLSVLHRLREENIRFIVFSKQHFSPTLWTTRVFILPGNISPAEVHAAIHKLINIPHWATTVFSPAELLVSFCYHMCGSGRKTAHHLQLSDGLISRYRISSTLKMGIQHANKLVYLEYIPLMFLNEPFFSRRFCQFNFSVAG